MTENENKRNEALQSLCRDYLSRLSGLARKYGLLPQLTALIVANGRGTCVATLQEVELLSRAVDDERIARTDIPKLLERSYRYCVDNNIFDSIKSLKHVGIYSKVSALLFKAENNDKSS